MAPFRASRSGPMVTLSIFEFWATMRSRLGLGRLICRSSPWITGSHLARLDDDVALALEGELHGFARAPADEGLEAGRTVGLDAQAGAPSDDGVGVGQGRGLQGHRLALAGDGHGAVALDDHVEEAGARGQEADALHLLDVP